MDRTIFSDIKISGIPMKQSHWSAVELLTVGLICTFVTWYLQYLWSRRKIYRLANKLPGPFALPLIGCAVYFMGSPYAIFSNIMKMFNTYPEIFRVWFGQRLYIPVSDPKYYDILLTSCLRKEPLYRQAEIIAGHGLFSAPLDIWKKHRKLITPTFNRKILDGFVEIFSEQGAILTEQLKRYSGKGEFDIVHMLSKCALDIICETAMGVKVNAQTTDASYPKWADKMLEIIFLRIFVIWYHFESIFSRLPIGKEAYEIRKNMHEYSGKVVKEKMIAFERKRKQFENPDSYFEEELIKRKAFLDYLLELTSDEKVSFTEQELREEVDTFIVAGSDTMATTDCFVFTMLGLYQDLQEKVYEEVMDIMGPDRAVKAADLPKFKYMERFIKESMRLFPVGGMIVRAVDKDVDIGDYVIPSGTSVVFGILRTHRNKKYWPDPYKFDPDRFLPEEVAKRHPCTYIPFSYGPRNCIGRIYAMMAMKTLIATTVRKYRFSTSYKKVEDIKLKCSLVVKPNDGFKVSIECRD